MTDTIPLDDLTALALHSTPVNIDWQEARGENMDGWRFWEAFEAELTTDDGNLVTLWLISQDGSEADVAFTDDGYRLDLNDLEPYWQIERPCIHCGLPVSSDDGDTWVDATDGDACSGNPEATDLVRSDLVHEVAGVLTDSDFSDLSREPHGYAEGPMMNYWYPLDENDENSIGAYQHTMDAAEAAFRLRHHSLCLVEVGGSLGLALTGGGMDFTWDIVEAFVDLGFLPPLHFCDLPDMAGKGPGKRLPQGWYTSSNADEDGSAEVRIRVHNAEGVIVGSYPDVYTAQRQHEVPYPASPDDQRVIDAVTRSLETARERITYQLQRHQERYSPTPKEQP